MGEKYLRSHDHAEEALNSGLFVAPNAVPFCFPIDSIYKIAYTVLIKQVRKVRRVR